MKKIILALLVLITISKTSAYYHEKTEFVPCDDVSSVLVSFPHCIVQ